MTRKIIANAVSRKCRAASLSALVETPPQTLGGTRAQTPSRCLDDEDDEIGYTQDAVLALAAAAIGRKELAHRMHWSPSMLKQAISGEKTSFLIRTDQFIDLLLEIKHADIALALCDRFCQRVGATVVTAAQIKVIKEIAAKAGTRISFDEWENG